MLAIPGRVYEGRITERKINEARIEAQSLRSRSGAALIEAVAGGDRSAMQVLYARHHVRIYRFLLRLTNDASVAEELVSDVFFAVWRDAASFAGKSEPSTWMLAIARHKAFTALKRRSHESLTNEMADAIADPADGAETMIDRNDRSAAIRGCLARLSPDHREVIDLVYYHDKSVEEVAEITGVPRSTVKTRMFYARKSLAKLLAASGCVDEAMAQTLH
jgi:RNA polymerase sigma-70 factor, ECF subfamily